MRRTAVLAGLLVLSLVALGLVRASAAGPSLMDGWYVYDYRAGLDVTPAVNVFEPAVEHGGAVWANHRQWSIDDPESPPSILALVRYAEWDRTREGVATTGTAGLDLRGECVRFDLRGERLDLDGAAVTFWVMSAGQRWHTTILDELGDEWTTVRVDVDSARWRNSWRWDPQAPPELDAALGRGTSYGIGFVGFEDEEPTGMLGMRGFAVGC